MRLARSIIGQEVPAGGYLSNLLLYWDMDETSGTRADTLGSYDLTDSGGTGYATGVNSNCASLDGTDDYLYCSNPFASGSAAKTLLFRIKIPSTGVFYRIFQKDNTTGNHDALAVTWVNYGGGRVRVYAGTSYREFTVAQQTTSWVTMMVVVPANATVDDIILYIDGSAATVYGSSGGTTSISWTGAGGSWWIGHYGTTTYEQFLIDEVALWDGWAANATEAADLVDLYYGDF